MKNVEPASQSVSAIISVGTGVTPLLAADENRRTVILQNCGIVPVFVKLGSGCTTSDFSFILAAGTAANDGLGSMFGEDVLSYQGIITATTASSTANVAVTSI